MKSILSFKNDKNMLIYFMITKKKKIIFELQEIDMENI